MHILFIITTLLTHNFIQGKSKTTFSPRQISLDTTFELALTAYEIYDTKEEKPLQLHIKPFYQQSFNGDKVATYFLPNNKKCVSVREDGTGDINPEWFNVVAPSGALYSSTLCLSPQRKAYGAVITFFAELCKKWWLLANTAAIGVEHNLHLCETNRTQTGTVPGFKNLCDGFNNKAWTSGKLSCKSERQAGLDDIQIKIGRDLYHSEILHTALYGAIVIPTGITPTAELLFEPTVGSRHAIVGFGLDNTFNIYNHTHHRVALLTDVIYRYTFQATERRSFDLCELGDSSRSDWSRYVLVANPNQPLTALPGINYLTLPAKVTPGSGVDAWAALHYECYDWHLELGYNFWWRQTEKVSLKCCKNTNLKNNVGIFDLNGPLTRFPLSASTATIADSIVNDSVISDDEFIPITIADINTESAAQPHAITNKIYIGTAWHSPCRPIIIGFNASYETCPTRNALNKWAIWGTFGFGF